MIQFDKDIAKLLTQILAARAGVELERKERGSLVVLGNSVLPSTFEERFGNRNSSLGDMRYVETCEKFGAKAYRDIAWQIADIATEPSNGGDGNLPKCLKKLMVVFNDFFSGRGLKHIPPDLVLMSQYIQFCARQKIEVQDDHHNHTS